ncbi:MAG: hypothetical protein AUG09_06750 [Acidobacteria bacterium 13_1_20CM_2_68_7]|nr:MAG: hypothetical protein AUG09_06750 [Acidobacteria bacterium 13_1_20CM_2_68_7]
MRRVGLAFALALCLAGAHAAVARWIAGAAGFPLDDAWIHARLARSLAEGRGFSFNPGEPAAVSSAPLWTLLVSVPAAAAIPFPWAAYLAGAAAGAALSLLGFRLTERATGDSKAGLLCAALLLGTHPFPWSIASGMEPAFAAALALATLLAALSGRMVITFLLASAAGLARPELCLMPGFVLLDALCRLQRPGPKRIARLSLAALAATAAPFLIDRLLTGQYVFAALAAKVGRHGVIAALGEGRADLVPSILAANLPLYFVPLLRALARDNVALLVLAPIGCFRPPWRCSPPSGARSSTSSATSARSWRSWSLPAASPGPRFRPGRPRGGCGSQPSSWSRRCRRGGARRGSCATRAR